MTDYNREQAKLGEKGSDPNDNGAAPEPEEETEPTPEPKEPAVQEEPGTP